MTATHPRRLARPARLARPRGFWVRTLRALGRHLFLTTPWTTIFAGCASGTGLLLVLAHLSHASHLPLNQDTVRIGFLPPVMALAFVLRAPGRVVSQAAPLPAWLPPAGQICLVVPVLVVTGWVQLHIMASTVSRGALHPPPAVSPLIAQLVGWCAMAVAAAGCCDRSRYADLGGAIAAPIALGIIVVAWFVGAARRYLVTPPASASAVMASWYGVAVVAVAVAVVAMRDGWHRYTRRAVVEACPAQLRRRRFGHDRVVDAANTVDLHLHP
ncbi:MAG: hypothetical protein ACRDZ8_02570 [Acidimicrobiales bacterium]